MPSHLKKLVRARMSKTGERYQTALRYCRAHASPPVMAQSEEPPGSLSMTRAILDTNVLLTIYSWHDFLDAARSVFEIEAPATLEDSRIQFRLRTRQARMSFALTLFFNEMNWATSSPRHELLRIMKARVPPTNSTLEAQSELQKPPGSKTLPPTTIDDQGAKENFVKIYSHFIKDRLLPSWRDDVLDADDGKKGSGVDRLCLDWAEEKRVPLISWEGDGHSGFNRSKLIPKEAAKRGIDLVTPEELLRRERFNPTAAAQRFFAGWRNQAPSHLLKHPDWREHLELAYSFYRRMAEDDWTGFDSTLMSGGARPTG